MFTRKEKEALNDIARSIQEVYNFSLIPEDKNFKRPEEITEQMGGGMLVDKSTFSVKVCMWQWIFNYNAGYEGYDRRNFLVCRRDCYTCVWHEV